MRSATKKAAGGDNVDLRTPRRAAESVLKDAVLGDLNELAGRMIQVIGDERAVVLIDKIAPFAGWIMHCVARTGAGHIFDMNYFLGSNRYVPAEMEDDDPVGQILANAKIVVDQREAEAKCFPDYAPCSAARRLVQTMNKQQFEKG